MSLQARITLRDIPPSLAVEQNIEKKIDKLQQFHPNIMRCDVVVELAQNCKHQGKLFNIRIDLTIPGGKLVSNHAIDEDVYVAIRDAFKALQKRLQSFYQQQRGDVKWHSIPMHGTVARIFDDFGFISANGEDYYFSDSNVVYPSFNKLHEGSDVRFLADVDADGLRALRISAGKHH